MPQETPIKRVSISECKAILESQGYRMRRRRYEASKDQVTVKDYLLQIEPPELAGKYVALYDAHPFFKECPAGAKHHHWWVGGLEEHIKEMIGMGLDIMELYPGDLSFTSTDIIIACFLHDFAKIWTYRYITPEERAKPNKFRPNQIFTYQEGAQNILNGEARTVLKLNEYGVPVSDKQWSAVLYCEGAFGSAHWGAQGLTATSDAVFHHNHLAAFMNCIDMYSAQILGRSIA